MVQLNLLEVQTLINEIKGLRNTATGEIIFKGFLNQKLSFSAKYWVETHLVSKLDKASSMIDEKEKELIAAHSLKVNEKGHLVPQDEEDKEGIANFIKDREEYAKSESIDIDFSMPMSYLSTMEANEHYPIFSKFIKE